MVIFNVLGCFKLLEVVPSSAIVEVIMVCKPVSNHVRLFRAVLDCFGHLESDKLSKLFSAAKVRFHVKKFRWFYVVVDRIKLLDIVSACAL